MNTIDHITNILHRTPDKLSDTEINDIFSQHAHGVTQTQIAKQTGMTQYHVGNILRRTVRRDVLVPDGVLERSNARLRKPLKKKRMSMRVARANARKLTEANINEIFNLRINGMGLPQISQRYNLSTTTIRRILNREAHTDKAVSQEKIERAARVKYPAPEQKRRRKSQSQRKPKQQSAQARGALPLIPPGEEKVDAIQAMFTFIIAARNLTLARHAAEEARKLAITSGWNEDTADLLIEAIQNGA